jgi:hypothetical protein
MQKIERAIGLPDSMSMDRKKFLKMLFLSNAIEGGWSVRKRDEAYTFSKKHEGRREVFMDDYLDQFVRTHSGIDERR